jgi:ubiquinone/menaquinone biosynthesis C-methylase UbiE
MIRLQLKGRSKMAHDVCPWWMGYLLASPIRKLLANPRHILAPYVHEGMTVLEPGPGMGFFTLEMARLVGPGGRIVAVDIQQEMLDALKRRAGRKNVAERIELRLAGPQGMKIDDLNGKMDLVVAFAVVHEMPDAKAFFRDAYAALKRSGKLLFAEPANHIDEAEFATSLQHARDAGFHVDSVLDIKSNKSVLMVKKP